MVLRQVVAFLCARVRDEAGPVFDLLQSPRIPALLVKKHALQTLVAGLDSGEVLVRLHRTKAFLRKELPLRVDFANLGRKEFQIQCQILALLLDFFLGASCALSFAAGRRARQVDAVLWHGGNGLELGPELLRCLYLGICLPILQQLVLTATSELAIGCLVGDLTDKRVLLEERFAPERFLVAQSGLG